MSTWPDINLDAVDGRAATLLSSVRSHFRGDDVTHEYHQELSDCLVEIDAAISSITAQIKAREGSIEDLGRNWKARAKQARAHYTRRRDSIRSQLKVTASIIIQVGEELRTGGKHAARLTRIQEANSESERWSRAFRKVCRRELGELRFLELVEMASKETLSLEQIHHRDT